MFRFAASEGADGGCRRASMSSSDFALAESVSAQENRCGSPNHAGKAAGAEAKDPGEEARRATELIEGDAEQQGSEEPRAKADAGIEPDRCPSLPRGGNSEYARGE